MVFYWLNITLQILNHFICCHWPELHPAYPSLAKYFSSSLTLLQFNCVFIHRNCNRYVIFYSHVSGAALVIKRQSVLSFHARFLHNVYVNANISLQLSAHWQLFDLV